MCKTVFGLLNDDRRSLSIVVVVDGLVELM